MRRFTQTFLYLFAFVIITYSSGGTTTLNYLFTYEIQQSKDFAEVLFQVKAKDEKLSRAFQKTDFLIGQIQQITDEYCKKYKLKQSTCKVQVQIADEELQPLYTVNKKKMTFSRFQNFETIKLSIQNVKNVGNLIDGILKVSSDISMLSFDWTQKDEDQTYQKSLKAGINEGHKLCSQMKGQLETILKVEEVVDFEVQLTGSEDEYTEEENEEQQNEQSYTYEGFKQPDVIQWNFEVLCRLS